MKIFTSKIFILAVIAGIVLGLTAWVDDPPDFHTGAPGELTCGSCHVAPASNPSLGTLEIIDLPDTLQPSTEYRIKVRMTKTSGDAIQAGFQMTLINERQEKFGVFSNPSPHSAISVRPYRDYFENRTPGSFSSGNVVEWEVTWTSPAPEEGFSQVLRLYASGIMGNADSSITGDVTLNTNETVRYISPYRRLEGSVSGTNISCNGGNDGTATANATGGKPPYKYTWNTGDTTDIVGNLKAGTYSMTITDQGTDTIVKIVTLTQPLAVFGTIIKTDIPCNSSVAGEAIVVPNSGVPPYSFLWSNGDTTNTTSFTKHGPISVVITDANGCAYTATSSIIKKGDFTASISEVTNVRCYGGSTGTAQVTTSAQFPTSYTWSNGASTSYIEGLTAGTYSVTVSDVDGCEARATAEVLQPTPIQVKKNLSNQPSCRGSFNGYISVFADGGVPPYSFVWEDGSTLKTLSNLTAGDYTVTVTDAFGCVASGTFSLNEPEEMAILIDKNDESGPDANNGKALIIPSGGSFPYTYLWSDGVTTRDRTGLAPGYYTVTVTDIKGCTAESGIYIAPYNCSLSVDDVEVHDVDCEGTSGGFIHLNVSGGTEPYTFTWSNGANTQNLDQVKSGKYTLTITDAAGCKSGGFFSINQPPPFKRTLTITDASAADAFDGKAKVVISGGVPPYTMIYDIVDTLSTYTGIVTFENQEAGLHSVHITDANGCVHSEFFVINIVGCQLAPSNVVIQDVKCNGGSDGAICVGVSGATGAYELFWDDETSGSCLLDLGAGKYSLYIADEAGCQSLDTFTIKQPSILRQISLNIVKPDPGLNNGSISVFNTGGVPDYTYTWYRDSVEIDGSGSLLTGLGSGIYYYELKDANGCTFASDTFNLIVTTSNTRRLTDTMLKVYPNPTNGHVYLDADLTENSRVRVFNSLGLEVAPVIRQDRVRMEIDFVSLPSGIYTIMVERENGRSIGRVVRLD